MCHMYIEAGCVYTYVVYLYMLEEMCCWIHYSDKLSGEYPVLRPTPANLIVGLRESL